MLSTLDSATRRLTLAMLVSVAIHLLPILGGWLHVGESERGRQIVVLQASLQPLPNKPAAKPVSARRHANKTQPPKKNKTPMEGVLTGKAPETLPPPEQGKPEHPAGAEESGSREALLVDDPGAPSYPDEALRRNLESCVLAAVYISPDGEVESVRILHADVAEVFDQSVIDAQKAARYLPARNGTESAPSRVLAVASFVLEAGRFRNCAFKYAAVARQINALPVAAEIDPSLLEALPSGQ